MVAWSDDADAFINRGIAERPFLGLKDEARFKDFETGLESSDRNANRSKHCETSGAIDFASGFD